MLKMLSQDIFDLQDDGFDGSKDELLISQEVFYGNVAGVVSKRSETDKVIELPCSNSENSALTNQASSEDLHEKDANHAELYQDSRSQNSIVPCFVDERIDHDVQAKRIKLSVNKLCSFKPYLDDAVISSVPLKKVIYGTYHPEQNSLSHVFMCHVVESSSNGLTSSCYLLKQDQESKREGNMRDCVAPNGSLSGSDGSEVKHAGACKSMASPVSQESSATKLLVSSQSTEKKLKIVASHIDEDDNVQLAGNDMKHLSAVLRSKVYRLLESLGWSPEKQIRNDGRKRYLYRSPVGRRYRALAKVWFLVGNYLFAHNNSKVVVDGKQWSDITKLCSDLYGTLKYIESRKDEWKSRCALTCLWRLLDPFVNVVLVNRKVTALRNGNLVKANESNEFDMDGEVDFKSNLNPRNSDVNRNVKEHAENIIFDSSLGHGTEETEKTRSIYVYEGDDMRLLKTIEKDENCCLGVYTDENMHTTSNQFSSDVSNNACLKYSGSLYNVPLLNEDSMIYRQSETTSPFLDSCMSPPQCDKGNMEKVKGSTVCSVDGGDEPFYRTMVYEEVNMQKITEDNSDTFPVFELCVLCQAEPGDIISREGWSMGRKKKVNNSTKKSRLKKPQQIKGLCLEEPNSDITADAFQKRLKPKKHGSIKKRKGCPLEDCDLLVSAIIKKRSTGSGKNKLGPKPKKYKSKSLKKRKSRKGGCRLRLRGHGKVGKQLPERWTLTSERTILSWLIGNGAVSINDAIQYRDPKDDSVVKDGVISSEGIQCRCCNEVFSVSEFKNHAGFNQNRPCLNLYMGHGRSYTLSQLQAWSDEYKLRKSNTLSVPVDEFDKNDDSCGICGDVGELLCCDNCPSTFHQSCLSAEEIPEGSWYCANCKCQVCGELADDKENLSSYVALRCSQCEKKYHQVCLTEKEMDRDVGAPWFCGVSCEEVYVGLLSRIGLSNQIGDSYSWTLLTCIQDDQKVSSAQRFALKAECNSKLAVAATIMEECFLSMVDPRTGIDMIPQVVYNWGSEFARLDYHGFYTAVLEKNDVLISIASIRVHGVAVAEMPLIATCSKYRRQGMCRRLLISIEEMLTSLKVEKLVIAAIPDLVETWTVGFGFVSMEDDEKRSLNKINLMVFPGTVMLKKTLFVNYTDGQNSTSGVGANLVLESDESLRTRITEGVSIGELEAQLISSLDQNSDETQKCGVNAEMDSELLTGFSSHETENGKTHVEDFRRENKILEPLNMLVGSAGKETSQDSERLNGFSSLETENVKANVEDSRQENNISELSNTLVGSAEKETSRSSELLNGFSSHETENVTTNVDDFRQEHKIFELSTMLVGSAKKETSLDSEIIPLMLDSRPNDDKVTMQYPNLGTESKVNEYLSQHVAEDQDNDLQIAEHNIARTVQGTEINEETTNITVSIELVVGDEEATLGREKGGNVTSNLGKRKEHEEGGKSMHMWDYWKECVGELEPLDGVLKLCDDNHCRYEEPVIAKEKTGHIEPQCINVAETQLCVIKESQKGNVLP